MCSAGTLPVIASQFLVLLLALLLFVCVCAHTPVWRESVEAVDYFHLFKYLFIGLAVLELTLDQVGFKLTEVQLPLPS